MKVMLNVAESKMRLMRQYHKHTTLVIIKDLCLRLM
jgi:hypothetical protein